MSEKTADRRTLKTQKAIREALAQLLMKKELHKVTVQEIADIADVNRVTFYKHYLDVYDLFDKIEQDLLVDLGLLILRLEELPSKEIFKHLIDYIDENRTVFKMMFCPNSTGQLRDKFSKCLEGLFRQIESEKINADLNNSKLSFRTCYRAQGCIAIISKWVQGDFSESKDFLFSIITELDQNTEKLISSK